MRGAQRRVRVASLMRDRSEFDKGERDARGPKGDEDSRRASAVNATYVPVFFCVSSLLTLQCHPGRGASRSDAPQIRDPYVVPRFRKCLQHG